MIRVPSTDIPISKRATQTAAKPAALFPAPPPSIFEAAKQAHINAARTKSFNNR